MSTTSYQALESIDTTSLRQMVLDYVCLNGPATCDEIEVALGLRHQTASARIRELVQMGRLTDSRRRRHARSGRSVIVWSS